MNPEPVHEPEPDIVQREAADEQFIELREEELVVHREMQDVGEARIRTRVEEVPAHVELDVQSEEVEVERVPMGQVVAARGEPYQEGDVLIVPVYEEQLVVTKQLVLREQLRIRRVTTTRRQQFEQSVRRERAEVEDENDTGLVHERIMQAAPAGAIEPDEAEREHGGLVDVVRRALQ